MSFVTDYLAIILQRMPVMCAYLLGDNIEYRMLFTLIPLSSV